MSPKKLYLFFSIHLIIILSLTSVVFSQAQKQTENSSKKDKTSKVEKQTENTKTAASEIPSDKKTGTTSDEKVVTAEKISDRDDQKAEDESLLKQDESRYRIGFQDLIQVTVFRHPELSATYSINPNGTIFLPRLKQPVIAICKTERELSNDIAAAYGKDYLKNPFVDVRAVEQKSQSFGVMGAVDKPGMYYVNRRVHLLELLTLAGGPTDKAGTQMIVARTGSSAICQSQNTAQISVDDPSIEVFNFKIKDVQKASQYLWMKPGDIVSVLEADPYYVMGNVNKAGMYFLKSPTTLTQAIATAEGFKPASKTGKIRILRMKPDSNEREDLVFNLKDIDNKKIQDPFLQPNDIVAVSEDKIKSIISSIAKSLSGGAANLPIILR